MPGRFGLCSFFVVLSLLTCSPVRVVGDASIDDVQMPREGSVVPQETALETPAEASGVLDKAKEALWKQLHTEKRDWLNAVGALVVGFMLILNSSDVLKWALAGCVFVVVYLLSAKELATSMSDSPQLLQKIGAAELGALAALAAAKGYPGLLLLVGGGLGVECAERVNAMLTAEGHDMAGSEIVTYTLVVGIFVWAFNSKFVLKVLALVSSLLGGLFMASAIEDLLTMAATHAGSDFCASNGFSPTAGAWIDFVALLLNKGQVADVGVYSGKTMEVNGTEYPKDLVVGRVFWAFFFLLGTATQFGKLNSAKAREPLREPLLQSVAIEEPLDC